METKNHYTFIEYGKGKDLLTRNDALEHARTEIIPQLLIDLASTIVGEPEVIDGRKAGQMYVRVKVKK